MARSGHAAGSEQGTQGKGGDAELIIGGVLTRWTQVSTVLIGKHPTVHATNISDAKGLALF